MSTNAAAVHLFELAVDETAAGKYPEAQHLIQQALAKDPNYADAWTQLGTLHYLCEEYQQSVQAYSRAIQLAPRDPLAWTGRGTSYEKLGDYHQALADHNAAIQLDPNLDASFANRGSVYIELGDMPAAKADFERAYFLNPLEPDNLYRMGQYYFEMGYYSEAYSYLNQAVEAAPDNGTYRFYRGATLDHLERPDLALPDLNLAIAQFPQFARAYTFRGLAYRLLERNREAFDDFSAALRLGDHSADVFEHRADLYFDAKHYEEAIRDYSRAIEIDPDWIPNYCNRLLAYKALGQNDQVRREMHQIDQLFRRRVTEIAKKGTQLPLAIVMANQDLYLPGDTGRFAFGVLSFEKPYCENPQALSDLAVRVGNLKGTVSTNPAENEVAIMVSHEMGSLNRRRPLPRELTGGPLVWYVDLWLHRPFLPKGQLIYGERVFSCIAEPGPTGRVELWPGK
ncbi:tetratricopeptide repeat protein [Blastopirellula sp. JC732]|uniref:Tetratricopeptide repeat protein n=1 Tax=Blastopirellula sediminis TaxID=2894196 RepID=A0A9X1SHE8_9BACT|nr:tetratricopeptide repeat protein [Blastopirellula sediminis]MCC9605565.1 tetratricopeptide repeat protein [Blastopirellula sediminis]MCC9631135.1 tetratricopeptide repeat protein [Blastopirellula sediminis]